jgi:hypothetical protein
MNFSVLDTAFSELLGDPSAGIYSAESRKKAIGSAVREYSRYYPIKKSIGYGCLFEGAGSGASTISALGLFSINKKIKLFSATGYIEEVTVTNIAIPAASSGWLAGTPRTLSITPNLGAAFPEGSILIPEKEGLSIQAGTDIYLLPSDFVSVDLESFNQAIGKKLPKKRHGFYDSAYENSRRLSGVGFGRGKNFAGAVAFPMTETPILTPDSLSEPMYTIVEGDAPYLQITPVPTKSEVLKFQYNAYRILSAIPDYEQDLLLTFAHYKLLEAQAASLAPLEDYKEDDVSESASANARALTDMADKKLTEWKRLISQRPILVSG